ncbi:MAG: radical SAM protein [Planctomycetota bacterium]
MASFLANPLKSLRKRASSMEHRGLLVDRTVYTDLHTLTRIGRPWEHREEETPRELVIETTNVCNANCVFCAYQYQDQFRAGKGVMKDEVFEKALADYKAMGGEAINFTPLVGDALVDPQITKRIARVKELGFHCYFYTNGILFNRIDLNAFLDAGVDQLMISTSPFERESHELIYRTSKYDDLLQGVHKLLKLRKERGIEVEVKLTFRAETSLQDVLAKSDFREYILPYLIEQEVDEIDVLVRRYDTWGGLIKPEDLVGNMQVARAPKLKFRPCSWTFVMMVMYDGKVRACSCSFNGKETHEGNDGLYVGDLTEEPLVDIWRGERLRDLRRSYGEKRAPDVCRSCSMYKPA